MPCSCKKKSDFNKASSVFVPSKTAFMPVSIARHYKARLQMSDSASITVVSPAQLEKQQAEAQTE